MDLGHWHFGRLFHVNVDATIELLSNRLDYHLPKAPQEEWSLCPQLELQVCLCFHALWIKQPVFIFTVLQNGHLRYRSYWHGMTAYQVSRHKTQNHVIWIYGSCVILVFFIAKERHTCNETDILVSVN